MSRRSIILFIVLFILVIAGMFFFAYLERTEQTPTIQVVPAPSEPVVATSTPYQTRVDAKHYYNNGVHTFAGIIDMPTPCHLLEASTRVLESMPEQVILDFKVVNNAELCIQVITPQRFKVEAVASSEASITATWNGVPIELNLIPAAPGETPESFELFIKG
jgi:hypothetical protein